MSRHIRHANGLCLLERVHRNFCIYASFRHNQPTIGVRSDAGMNITAPGGRLRKT
jgi:hypothetical protein